MKNLKIEYNGSVLFDGDVEEFQWNDGPQGVSVAGKLKRQQPAGGANPVGGFLEKLVGASKQQTQQVIEEKRASLITDVEVEPVVE